jgi:carbonic anhydrase
VLPTKYDKNGIEWRDGMCYSRERQSPINFDTHLMDPATEILKYNYEPLRNIQLQMTVRQGLMFVDTSHLQVGSVVFNGMYFPLVRIDFHVGSEHLLKGKRYSMEIQLVHRNVDDPMKQLIIAVPVWSEDYPQPADIPLNLFLKRRLGLYYPPKWTELDHNPQLQHFLTVRPPAYEGQIVNVVIPFAEPLDLASFVQDPVIPESATYIQYSGSLTTPPCSDLTTWFVRRHPMVASSAQTKTFAESIYRLTNNRGNFRAVMPVNARPLSVYRAQWVPYVQLGTKPLPLGPNSRTDGEYQAAKLAEQAHTLSTDSLDYMADFADRLEASAGNLTWHVNQAEQYMHSTPAPLDSAAHMMKNAQWVRAVLKTRAAIQSIANNVQSNVDEHMRKQTMQVHKWAAKEANKARMLTKAWIPAPSPAAFLEAPAPAAA